MHIQGIGEVFDYFGEPEIGDCGTAFVVNQDIALKEVKGSIEEGANYTYAFEVAVDDCRFEVVEISYPRSDL